MLFTSDAPNPAVPRDVVVEAERGAGACVEVARRGTLLIVWVDGETGFLARADLSATFADLDPGEQALLRDVFEEEVEAALHERGCAEPAAVTAAIEEAIGALGAFGLGAYAGRLAAALAEAAGQR